MGPEPIMWPKHLTPCSDHDLTVYKPKGNINSLLSPTYRMCFIFNRFGLRMMGVCLTLLITGMITSACKPDVADNDVRTFVREQRKTQIEELNIRLTELKTRKESIEKDLNEAQLFTQFKEQNKERIEKDQRELVCVESDIEEAQTAVRGLLADLEKAIGAKK